VPGEEPDRPAAQQRQRVEVGLAAAQAPVQAGRPGAADVAAEQPAEDGAAGDRRALPDGDRQRLVGGPQPARMLDRDDAPAGQHAGVGDHTWAGGQHKVTG
jgi:hypothetical protein